MLRLPAHEIEALVVAQVVALLETVPDCADAFDAAALQTVRERRAELALSLREGNQVMQRTILLELGVAVAGGGEQVEVRIGGSDYVTATANIVPTKPVGRGAEVRMVIPGDGSSTIATPDPVLLKLIVLAFAARDAAIAGNPETLVDHYSRQHQTRLARLSYLAPDIIGAIVDGSQPPQLNGRRLLRIADLPLDWNDQRKMLRFV